ncbi:5'-flap endonuclease [Sporothrix eucalyptigena]
MTQSLEEEQAHLIIQKTGEILSRRNNVFKSLQTSYGCDETPANSTTTAATTVTGSTARDLSFTKRKAIEAISIGDTGRKTSPTKTKAPKKKTRTLTELAVAAYTDGPAGGEGTAATTVTKRQLEVIDESAPLAEVEVRQGFPTSKLRKLKSVTTAAAKKSRRKTKKAPAPRKPILLSPESARAASNAQDFLFGTSSQLASEHSPTILRHLHTAMQESNRTADNCAESDDDAERNRLLDLFAEISEADISTVDLTGQRTPAPGNKRKLWGAAARGEDGHLAFDNVIDLEDAIEFPEDPHQVIAMAQRAAAEAVQKETQDTEVTPSVTTASATQKPKATQSSRAKGKQPSKAKAAQTQDISSAQPPITRTEAITQVEEPTLPPATLTEPKATKTAKVTKAMRAAKEKEAVRPNFEILTTAQLAKKVSDYGYKAMKARSAMVALLNQCWDAQHPSPAGQLGQTFGFSTLSATAPANVAEATANSEPVAQAQTQPKPKAPRVTKPKAAKATKTTASAKVTQTTISGATTVSRALTAKTKATPSVSPSAAAAIHTTAATRFKAATSPAKTKARRTVFEIGDSESDGGRFSSPEPTGPIGATDGWSLVEGNEKVVDESDFLDIDDIVTTDLEDNENDMSLADAPLTYEESALFQYISTAVTNQPRATDPTAPSWHEKILMYDTIILETFTAWLNNGPLQAAGYAGVAIDPQSVKKWCESKSVCCTWRKNLHGKERKW